jgi:hypothetical protein
MFFPSQKLFFPSQKLFFPSQKLFFPSQKLFFPSQKLFFICCKSMIIRYLQSLQNSIKYKKYTKFVMAYAQ